MKMSALVKAIGAIAILCVLGGRVWAQHEEQLIESLRSKDVKTREAASAALKELGPKVAVPALLKALRDSFVRKDKDRMQSMLDAMDAQGGGAVPVLFEELWKAEKTGDRTASAVTSALLVETGRKDARPLVLALKDAMEKKDDRGMAIADVVLQLGPDPLIAIRRKEANSDLRRLAVLMLGRMAVRGNDKAMAGVKEAVDDKDERVRAQAGNVLVGVRDEKGQRKREGEK